MLIEREVLAVSEAFARKDDRQVFVVVDFGIPHVTAIEHHGAIQQRAIWLFYILEVSHTKSALSIATASDNMRIDTAQLQAMLDTPWRAQMASQYSPRNFIRHIPKTLLQEVFAKFGLLKKFAWKELGDDLKPLLEKWQKLKNTEGLESVFVDVHQMADQQSIDALIDQANASQINIASELESLEGFHHKLLWTWLHHIEIFNVVRMFRYADGLTTGRYWRTRTDIPQGKLKTSKQACVALGNELSGLYWKKKGCGRECHVEHEERVNGVHYYFCYPKDHADAYVGYEEEGFVRRSLTPAIELIYAYDPKQNRLDMYAKGDKKFKQKLQAAFATHILDVELGPEDETRREYDLDRLLNKGFAFETDAADGINEVRLRRMHLAPRVNVKGKTSKQRRIMLEAHPEGPADDVYQMLDDTLIGRSWPETNFTSTKSPSSLLSLPSTTSEAQHCRSTCPTLIPVL